MTNAEVVSALEDTSGLTDYEAWEKLHAYGRQQAGNGLMADLTRVVGALECRPGLNPVFAQTLARVNGEELKLTTSEYVSCLTNVETTDAFCLSILKHLEDHSLRTLRIIYEQVRQCRPDLVYDFKRSTMEYLGG